MSRHSVVLKRSIVDRYLSGEESYASAGAIDGVDAATVRKWVAAYRAHGDSGLCRKIDYYDAAFKLSVLERMWGEGLSYRQTAALFNIRNAGCLAGWEKRYHAGGTEALAPRRRGRPRSMPEPPEPPAPGASVASDDETRSRQELLAELNYLRMENAYLKKLEALMREHAPKKRKWSKH